MSKASEAFTRAEKKIATAAKSGELALNFDIPTFRDLTEIPAQIATLTGLQRLDLSRTQITDLAPLAGLTGLQRLWLHNTQISDLAPLAGLTGLQRLYLSNTQITDLAPLAGLTGLQSLVLRSSQITDLAPLAGLTGLQYLYLDNTQITDLAPLAGVTGLQDLSLDNTSVLDMRPIAGLDKLGSNRAPGLTFTNTPATARDARLAELAAIEDEADRARQTLAYLRSLPKPPLPYTPAATPDGSPPQPIGDSTLAQAQRVSDALPLAEDLIQNPDTGAFDVRPRPAVKPDLYAVNLEQVADAVADVLRNPRNGLNADSPVIFRLKRTLDRYANDPQRVEKDFTTAHASLTHQMVVGDLPASDENQHLQFVLQEAAQGIRATHADIAVNRRIQQEQALRELTDKDHQTIADAAPVLAAITEGDLQAQMAEDIAALTAPPNIPRLPGVTRADSILGYDEAARVFGRTARIVIKVRAWRAKLGEITDDVRESPEFKAYDIIYKLSPLIMLGASLLILTKV